MTLAYHGYQIKSHLIGYGVVFFKLAHIFYLINIDLNKLFR
jgi:hypothetical protein